MGNNMKILNLAHANALLIQVAHLALEGGVFKSFEHTSQIGEAVKMASNFIDATTVDAPKGDFRLKMDVIENAKKEAGLTDSAIKTNTQLKDEEFADEDLKEKSEENNQQDNEEVDLKEKEFAGNEDKHNY